MSNKQHLFSLEEIEYWYHIPSLLLINNKFFKKFEEKTPRPSPCVSARVFLEIGYCFIHFLIKCR